MTTPRLSIAFIQHQVAKAYGIDPRIMTSNQRSRKLARPRQVAMWITAKVMPGLSRPQIGRAFDNRDHTTIMHGIRKVEEIRANDAAFADLVDSLHLSIIQQVTEPVTASQVAAERMAISVSEAFTVAALALARTNPLAAMQAFTPLARSLLCPSEEIPPCAS